MPNKIITVFGRKGTGKTTLVKNIVKISNRMMLIDPLNEYNNGIVYYDKSLVYDEIMNNERFRVVFRPLSKTDFEWFVDLAVAKGNVTLVIDEADQFTNISYMSKALYWVIHYGRHYDVSLILASRMPNRIRSDITAQADMILTFQQQGRAVLKYIDEFAEFDCVKEIKALKPFHFIPVLGKFSLDIRNELP